MDQIVRNAMEKWPDVPALFHWLSLDGRGQWRLRGDPITNPALVAFIGRNYASDAQGRWYFQNGPQRVYVSLDAAPWILRLDGNGMSTHTNHPVSATAFLADEAGHLYALTELGVGKVDDRDLARLLDDIEDSGQGLRLTYNGTHWPIETTTRSALVTRFGFDPDPGVEAARPAGQPRP